MNFEPVRKNLEALGYRVSCFDTAAEATEYINTANQNLMRIIYEECE